MIAELLASDHNNVNISELPETAHEIPEGAKQCSKVNCLKLIYPGPETGKYDCVETGHVGKKRVALSSLHPSRYIHLARKVRNALLHTHRFYFRSSAGTAASWSCQ